MDRIGKIIKFLFSEPGNDESSMLQSLEIVPQVEGTDGRKDETEALAKLAVVEIKSLLQMFQFATLHDKGILFLAVIFTIIHGASFPIMAVIFGNFCESFIAQKNNSTALLPITTTVKPLLSYSEPSNGNISGGVNLNIEDVFGSIGATLGLAGSPAAPLTRDEYLDYAATMSVYFAIAAVVIFVSSFIQTSCWECAATNQILRIRQNFLSSVLRQDASWFDTRTTGYLIVKLADDVERMREGIGHKFGVVLEYSACFFFGVLFGLATNWKLTIIFGTSVPFGIAKIFSLMRVLAKKSVEQQEQYGRIGGISAEVLMSARTVAAFGTEKAEQELYDDEKQNGLEAAKEKYSTIGFGIGFLYFLIFGSIALAFWYAANQLDQKTVKPGEVYTVFFCVSIGLLALVNILPYVPDVATAYGCSKILMSIINNVPTIDPYSRSGQRPHKVFGKIKFSDVTFSYPSRKDLTIIRDLSLTINSGETVAIVGPMGSAGGKSTLAQLLIRFYDPQGGYISYDDVNLKNLNVGWLRSQIGIVSRNHSFEEDTIFENLRAGRKDLTLDDVIEVAKITYAHDFIKKFPEKYDKAIGFTHLLSSGQRQLLALTRTLIKNPKVLVLDECLTDVDTATAYKVAKNALKYRKGCTNILISAHIAMVQWVDKIYYLENGEIKESGTHDQLMKLQGSYYKMAQIDNVGSVGKSLLASLETDHDDDDEPVASEVGYSDPMLFEPIGESGRDHPSTIAADIRADTIIKLEETEPGSERAKLLPDMTYPTREGVCDIIDEKGLRPKVQLGLFGCLICGLIIPIYAFVFGQIFIAFSEHGHRLLYDVYFWSKILIVVGIVAGIGYWLRAVFVNIIGEVLTAFLRATCYLSILRQSMGWFDEKNNSSGKLYVRLASDAPFFKVAVGSGLATATSAFISEMSALIYSAAVAWPLSIISIISLPVIYLHLRYQAYSYQTYQNKIMRHLQPALWLATDSIKDIQTVQALSLQLDILRRFINMIHPTLAWSHRQAVSFATSIAFSEGMTILILACIFRLGTYLVKEESLEPVILFRTFVILAFSAFTAGQVTAFIPDYIKAKLAIGYVFNFYDITSKIDAFEENGKKPDKTSLARIVFDNVWFSYPQTPDKPILRGISFTVEPGTWLGIIGGDGKSTVLSLLERYYDINAEAGQITFGGIPIADLKLDYLRRNIGMVSQESNLLNRSLRDNITYGLEQYLGSSDSVNEDDPKAAAELQKKIDKVAEIAGLHSDHFPMGYETIVGESGCRLTGGQKKVVAIARALIREPQILLMDEPTAGLDPRKEREILDALKTRVKPHTTCVFVTNSPRAIEELADKILVLQDGQIPEYGTRKELEEIRGLYCAFMLGNSIK